MPTLKELRKEIEGGELAPLFVDLWADVFKDDFEPPPAPKGETEEGRAQRLEIAEHRRERIEWRQGLLRPDSAKAILDILSDPSRMEKRNNIVSRGNFLAVLAPLSIAVASLPEMKQRYWGIILTLLTGGEDTLDIESPQIGQILDAAIADGILTDGYKAAIQAMGGKGTQSKLESLGWSVSTDHIQQARGA